MKQAWIFLCIALLPLLWQAQAGYELKLHCDRPERLYRSGEIATLTPETLQDAQPRPEGTLEYEWLQDGLTVIDRGTLELPQAEPVSLTTSSDTPGFRRCHVMWKMDGELVGEKVVTVGFEVDSITPGGVEPEDFDDFWQKALSELAAIPVDARITPAEDLPSDTFHVYRVSFANIDGTRIYGFYGVPKQYAGKLPGLVAIPGAGPGVSDPRPYFVPGTLSLLLNVHPFEAVSDLNRLQELNRQAYGDIDYCFTGKDSAETFFFRRTFLGFYRAIDWLCEQPEFDGEHLGITGSSQGGGSSLIMGGLHPKISYIVANIPAFCDLGSQTAGRCPGWPGLSVKYPGDPEVLKTGSYFDAAFFARRIDCPTVILVGYNDTICNPGGIYAVYNELGTADRKIVPKVDMTHEWPLEYETEYRQNMMNAFAAAK